MENDFRNVAGKTPEEAAKDIALFLGASCIIHRNTAQIDLSGLLPDRNIRGQIAFAVLSELLSGADDRLAAERLFCRLVVSSLGKDLTVETVIAFRNPDSEEYRSLVRRYGAKFTLEDDGYWSSCLALALDTGKSAVTALMNYFRLFTVLLTEIAYLEGRRPERTFVWGYFESFAAILENLTPILIPEDSAESAGPTDKTESTTPPDATKETTGKAETTEETETTGEAESGETVPGSEQNGEPAPEVDPGFLPLSVPAAGFRRGAEKETGYPLTAGCDLLNPNPSAVACGVLAEIHLLNRNGKEIATVREEIDRIAPASVFHLGTAVRVRGQTVAEIRATVTADHFLPEVAEPEKPFSLIRPTIRGKDGLTVLNAVITRNSGRASAPFLFSAQLLDATGAILGGGKVRVTELPDDGYALSLRIPVSLPEAAKLAWSAVPEVQPTCEEPEEIDRPDVSEVADTILPGSNIPADAEPKAEKG